MNLPRITVGMLSLAIAMLAAGYSPGQNQTASNQVGKSVATLNRYSMKLASNGSQVSVFPKDPLRPFDSTDWYAEVPITILAVRYDKDRQELLVSVDYSWRKSDEDILRSQLAWKYKEAGKPVAMEAISVTPLDVAAHSLLLRDMDKEYLLYSTEKQTKLTTQTAAFKVPMVDGASRLHERLSTTPETVQLVLRVGYPFDRIGGLAVERRALNSAWEKVCESILPNATLKADALLVDRNVEQGLQKKLAMEVEVVIKSYGLTTIEEAEAIKVALAQIEKLAVPSAPVTVLELLDLAEHGQFMTATLIKGEIKPSTNEEAITKLKEVRSFTEKLAKISEAISDIANDSSIDDRKFHRLARKMVLDAGGSAGFLCFSAKANMHLDQGETAITENHLKDIKHARTYAMNKSAYSRDVVESHSREVEGLLKKNESTAKLLTLRRISAATLAATNTQGWSVVRVTGTEVLFMDTPVALKATPIPAEDDIVAALLRRVQEQDRRLNSAEQSLKKTEEVLALNATKIKELTSFRDWATTYGGMVPGNLSGKWHEDNDGNRPPSFIHHIGNELLFVNSGGTHYSATIDAATGKITFRAGFNMTAIYEPAKVFEVDGQKYDTITLASGNTWRRPAGKLSGP